MKIERSEKNRLCSNFSPCFAAHFAISSEMSSLFRTSMNLEDGEEAQAESWVDTTQRLAGRRAKTLWILMNKNFVESWTTQLASTDDDNAKWDEREKFSLLFFLFILQRHQKSFSRWMSTIKRLNWKFRDERGVFSSTWWWPPRALSHSLSLSLDVDSMLMKDELSCSLKFNNFWLRDSLIYWKVFHQQFFWFSFLFVFDCLLLPSSASSSTSSGIIIMSER